MIKDAYLHYSDGETNHHNQKMRIMATDITVNVAGNLITIYADSVMIQVNFDPTFGYKLEEE